MSTAPIGRSTPVFQPIVASKSFGAPSHHVGLGPLQQPSPRGLIAPKVLDRALDRAAALIRSPIPTSPADPQVLLDQYLALGRAEVLATAALLEAADLPAYRATRDRALKTLAEIGRGYADRMPAFGGTVHAGKAWPTIIEEVPGLGRRYVNSFKKAGPLSFQEKAEIYRAKVEKFLAEGGDFKRDLIAPRSIADLEPGVRHDYVLLENGTIRCAPRGENLPDPGHAILAEGGATFRDTRVLMAGELRVIADDRGRVAAVVVACSSGHFKPMFEDVVRMKPALEKLGVSREQVILNGGPDNPFAILPEIAEKFGLQAIFPESLDETRRALKRENASTALKVWQRS